MKKKDDALLDLAEAVADGRAVQWEHETERHGELRGKLEHLRLLESVATAHREPVAGGETGPASESTTHEVPMAVPPPLPCEWGRLRIIERIGTGGFGEVYRAHDPILQVDVALKLVRTDRIRDESSNRRFLDEARRLASVRHQNVVVVHGADKCEGRVGLWTELLDGTTLEDCLEKQGPFGPDEAAVVGMEICRALAAVHEAGLVHRDVKTTNVMREKGGRIVLLDFSAVTMRVPAGGVSDAAPRAGTLLYMPPEAFREEDSGTVGDIYGLGVVLYRLVSAAFPVEADGLRELTDKHGRAESIPLLDRRPDLPRAFVQTVEKALSNDPAERYQTAGEMEKALGAVLGQRQEDKRVDLPTARRRKRIWLGAAAVMSVALGVLLWAWAMWHPPLEIDTSLYRVGDGVEERLVSGSVVRPGDRLVLEIHGSRPMYVYVVDEDFRGRETVLFPLAGMLPENPLSPGSHRLPGTLEGVEHAWTVTSAGASEVISVLASSVPVRGLERALEGVTPTSVGAPIEINGSDVPLSRGIEGLSPDPDSQPRRRLLPTLYHDLVSRGNGRDVRYWEIELRNPDEAGD